MIGSNYLYSVFASVIYDKQKRRVDDFVISSDRPLVILDKSFPKFDVHRAFGRLILEIALQISIGGIIITKLRTLSSFYLAAPLLALVPFTVVESVVMISPQPELKAKVNQAQILVKQYLLSFVTRVKSL